MAQTVIDEYAPRLQALLQDFGLPPRLSQHVRLQWNGSTFEGVTQNRQVLDLEVGDGKRPPLAAIRKTMNRLRPELEGVLRLRLEEGIDGLIEDGVVF
jgi:hypothetical protein